jgi:hypothetical protein
MKRQLETATEAPPELQSHDGADSTPEVLTAPELCKANDMGMQAPGDVAVSVLEPQAARTQPGGLLLLQLLWAKRRVTMQWALAG